MAQEMDFATAFGKLCDRYNIKVLVGAGELEGNMVVVDRSSDIPNKYALKRYTAAGGFFALESTDENHS